MSIVVKIKMQQFLGDSYAQKWGWNICR